jgi:hypothetical protein
MNLATAVLVFLGAELAALAWCMALARVSAAAQRRELPELERWLSEI